MSRPKRKLILGHHRAPGDVAMLTALVRDLALTYSDRLELGVYTTAAALWENNPYLPLGVVEHRANAPWTPPEGTEYIHLNYKSGIVDQNYETIHFLAYFHRNFRAQTGLHVPLRYPWPDIHLSAEEMAQPIVRGRYWVFLSGGKSDFTIKVWSKLAWERTLGLLREQGLQFVQTGVLDAGHWHPPIAGALNLVGYGRLRELLNLIYHADGVICGVTAAMHFAAALQRPCVVLGGGREAWWWEAYVRENSGLGGAAVAAKLTMPHRYLHTIGLLPCCARAGCWRNKVTPLNDDTQICCDPVIRPEQSVARCMDMITPEHVATAVLSYYYDGSLQPPPGTRLAEETAGLYRSYACQT